MDSNEFTDVTETNETELDINSDIECSSLNDIEEPIQELTEAEKAGAYFDSLGLNGDFIERHFSDNEFNPNNVSIDCRNKNLEGKTHPLTNVPFVRNIADFGEFKIESVTPVFDSYLDVAIPNGLSLTRNEQFQIAKEAFQDEFADHPDILKDTTLEDMDKLHTAYAPGNMAIHHNMAKPNTLEFVNREKHEKTAHSGWAALMKKE